MHGAGSVNTHVMFKITPCEGSKKALNLSQLFYFQKQPPEVFYKERYY